MSLRDILKGLNPQSKQIQEASLAGESKASGRSGTSIGEQSAIAAGKKEIRKQVENLQIQDLAESQQDEASKKQFQTQRDTLREQAVLADADRMAKTSAQRQERRFREGVASQNRSLKETIQIKKMNAQATQFLRNLQADKKSTLDNIFDSFRKSEKELEYRRDAAKLEQYGFQLAMSDRAYLDELNRVGKERQLRESIQFNEEMQRIALGDGLNQLLNEIGFKQKLNASQRDYNIALEKMGLQTQLMIAQEAIEQANTTAQFQGFQSIIQGGAKLYDSMEEEK